MEAHVRHAGTDNALRESEERFSAVFRESPTGMTISHLADGLLVDVNDAFCRIYGYSRDEALGRSSLELGMWPSPEERARLVALLKQHGRVQQFEAKFRRKSGEAGNALISASLIVLNGQQHVLGLQTDVTARMRAEELLRQSERRLKTILDTIPDPIWLKDKEGRFLTVNAAWCSLFGIDLADVMGKSGLEILPAEVAAEFHEQDREIIQSRRPLRFEELLHGTDGGPIWFETIKTPLFDEHGGCLGTTGVAREITARKRAEQARLEMESRLLHAQKLESIGIMAGGIAHDFNNILSGIMGYAELALMRMPASEPAREDIEVIKKAVRRAADLTQQMLAYSGKGRFVAEPVDLSRVVEDSRKMLDVSISKKAMLTCDLAPDLPAISADPSQMCQVLMNLVINASEALGEHTGAIAVSTVARHCKPVDLPDISVGLDLPEDLYVCLQVADSGCGMDRQTRAKIFDPFFTTKLAGRGLGLAAVQGIVHSHKGAIQVSSESGKGTTFRILFPASGAAIASVPREPAIASARGGSTVLVVDDEPTICSLTRQMLEHAGFSVLTAGGGREAVRLFRERGQEVGCVLMDLIMPELDGAETFAELRRVCPDVRVVLTSGIGEEAATAQFAGHRPACFIQKPFQFETLIASIQQALGKARMTNDE